MLKRLGYQGAHSRNRSYMGWAKRLAPHYHMIFFFDHEVDPNGIQSFLALNGKMLA